MDQFFGYDMFFPNSFKDDHMSAEPQLYVSKEIRHKEKKWIEKKTLTKISVYEWLGGNFSVGYPLSYSYISTFSFICWRLRILPQPIDNKLQKLIFTTLVNNKRQSNSKEMNSWLEKGKKMIYYNTQQKMRVENKKYKLTDAVRRHTSESICILRTVLEKKPQHWMAQCQLFKLLNFITSIR